MRQIFAVVSLLLASLASAATYWTLPDEQRGASTFTGAQTFNAGVSFASGGGAPAARNIVAPTAASMLFNATAYVDTNGLSLDYATNASASTYLNFVGYQAGVTQYRTTIIGNGKAAALATFAPTATTFTQPVTFSGGFAAQTIAGAVTWSGAQTIAVASGDNLTVEGRGRIWIKSASVGQASVGQDFAGLKLTASAMTTAAKYTPAIQFGSTDTDFTATNPKFGAAIAGYATESYTADTSGGMGLEFFATPNAPGTAGGLVSVATMTPTAINLLKPVTVSDSAGGILLKINDFGATSATDANPYLEYTYGSGGTRAGFLGYGTSSGTQFQLQNTVGTSFEVYLGGAIRYYALDTTGGIFGSLTGTPNMTHTFRSGSTLIADLAYNAINLNQPVTVTGVITTTVTGGNNLILKKSTGASLAIWADTTGASNTIGLDNISGTFRVYNHSGTQVFTASQAGDVDIPDGNLQVDEGAALGPTPGTSDEQNPYLMIQKVIAINVSGGSSTFALGHSVGDENKIKAVSCSYESYSATGTYDLQSIPGMYFDDNDAAYRVARVYWDDNFVYIAKFLVGVTTTANWGAGGRTICLLSYEAT